MRTDKGLFLIGLVLLFGALSTAGLLWGRERLAHEYTRPVVARRYETRVETGAPAVTDLTGAPALRIVKVAAGRTVAIEADNFPANRTFYVTMGPMGSEGISGIAVGTLDSGSSGRPAATFNIPAELAGTSRIAIRAQTADAYPYYYAFNWFDNTGARVTATPAFEPDLSYVGGGILTPPDLVIQTEWPAELEPNQSPGQIRVVLVAPAYEAVVGEAASPARSSATPIRMLDATPGATLAEAYGDEFTACATLTLRTDSPALQIDQDGACKPYRLSAADEWAEWDLPITPQGPGKQPIHAEISVKWLTPSGAEAKSMVVWTEEFAVNVVEPFITQRQLTFAAVVFATLGLLLWVSYAHRRAARRSRAGERRGRPAARAKPVADGRRYSGSLNALHQMLVRHFNLEELRDLCFSMGINYDELSGDNLSGKARELIAYVERRSRLQELIRVARAQRPLAAWGPIESGLSGPAGEREVL